jgi:ferric-chelate reductase
MIDNRHLTACYSGGPGDSVFASYSAAVFVVGGSGISFALSAVQDLVHKDLQRASRVKVIELIWCVQDHGMSLPFSPHAPSQKQQMPLASLAPFIPLFTSLIERSIFSPLRISVFYTRATVNPVEKTSFVNGLTLSPSRPRFGKILDAVVSRAVSLGSGVKDAEDITGVMVGVCGPLTLGDEVAKAIGSVDVRRREAVGGIELHEE